ncbi:MAG: site-specific integrase [Polyangiaceae bacterium]|nr:site-specific integrase [Polyangiaceae bacterium]
MSWARNTAEADARRVILAKILADLQVSGNEGLAESMLRDAAAASREDLNKIVELAQGLASGIEKPVPIPREKDSMPTVQEFGERWTNNDLARQYRQWVKAIDHTENARRMRVHVYPVVFKGRTVGETPMDEFTLDHAEAVLSQPTLKDGSVRHVAQCLHRIFKLAVARARILPQSPFPPGWLPPANQPKDGEFLWPEEEARLLACADVPLVWRVAYGVDAREGIRLGNLRTLRREHLHLSQPGGRGVIIVPKMKNGRRGHWRLGDDTAEALRRWLRLHESPWVFPTEQVPRHRRTRDGQPVETKHAAERLRAHLGKAGVTRQSLFEANDNTMRLRGHDLRATFVTLALARGRTRTWIKRRTGHCSDAMIDRYDHAAGTLRELSMGWLKPLHEAIPELAKLEPSAQWLERQSSPKVRQADPEGFDDEENEDE